MYTSFNETVKENGDIYHDIEDYGSLDGSRESHGQSRPSKVKYLFWLLGAITITTVLVLGVASHGNSINNTSSLFKTTISSFYSDLFSEDGLPSLLPDVNPDPSSSNIGTLPGPSNKFVPYEDGLRFDGEVDKPSGPLTTTASTSVSDSPSKNGGNKGGNKEGRPNADEMISHIGLKDDGEEDVLEKRDEHDSETNDSEDTVEVSDEEGEVEEEEEEDLVEVEVEDEDSNESEEVTVQSNSFPVKPFIKPRVPEAEVDVDVEEESNDAEVEVSESVTSEQEQEEEQEEEEEEQEEEEEEEQEEEEEEQHVDGPLSPILPHNIDAASASASGDIPQRPVTPISMKRPNLPA